MRNMFYNCTSLSSTFSLVIDCSSINDVNYMRGMSECFPVTTAALGVENYDIASDDTIIKIKERLKCLS